MKNRPIPLEAKPDWPQACKRWQAFWNNEVPEDRVLMSLTIPNLNNPYSKPQDPDKLEGYHTDMDFFRARRLHEVFSSEYLCEAVPSTWSSITGGYLGILLGGELKAMEEGVIWSEPFLESLSKETALEIDRENKWYKLTMEQISILSEYKDAFLTRIPDFHGISDALVSIRGGMELGYDIVDSPDILDVVCANIVEAWKDAYDDVYDCIAKFQSGSATWLGMWHPGRMEVVQEDFADLLSKEQYQQHFMKHDEEFCKHVDCAIFHLHNTMTRHQESTLDMPGITGTQFRLPYKDKWEEPDYIRDYLPLYNKMHQAGKKTWYLYRDEEDMKDAILNGDPRHLFLMGRPANLGSAKRVIDNAYKWTQQRIQELGI